MSDEELVRNTLAGDTASYGELVAKYEAPLRRYVVYLIGNPDMADDVLQDSFLKAYRNLHGFKPRLKFSSWLYRITHNTAIDAVKKQHLNITLEGVELDIRTAQESGIAERIDRQILATDIRRCLAQLQPKYREPIYLYYFEDKSYREISDILRLPVATAGVRIKRAKARLKEDCQKRGVSP